MFRWVMTTPFGSAVAPEVKMISTTVSRVTRAGARAPAWFVEAAALEVSPASRSTGTASIVPGVSSTSSPISASLASTMRATLPRKSGDAR